MIPPARAPDGLTRPGRETVFPPRRRARAGIRGRLYVDYPRRTRVVSVTGPACDLDCAHCGGHYLKTMTPVWAVPPPVAGESFLVSGGSDAAGRVPLWAHEDLIGRLARRGRLNVHTGLVLDDGHARKVGGLATTVSFDLIGCDDTIREIVGLERTVDDYVRSYRLLSRHAEVYPHICIGLHAGRLRGEDRAVEIIAREGAPGVVFLVFMPTPGTRLAHAEPPQPGEVLDFLAWARGVLRGVPVTLGCMRPPGSYRRTLDPGAVDRGVDGIVKPHPAALETARCMGREIVEGEHCCSLGLWARAREIAAGAGEEAERG